MRGVNKVILVGRLGMDPEVKYNSAGNAKCTFTLATSERYKEEEQTEWHRIGAFGKTAEICGQYLAKGSQVYIEGKIHTYAYEKDGQKRYITEIMAREVQFLDSKERDSRTQSQKNNQGSSSGAPFENDIDLPF